MKKILSAILKYVVPVIISVGLIWFLYQNVDLEAMKSTLSSEVNYLWFILVVIVSIMSHVFRGLRWRLQLRAIGVNAPLHSIVNSIFGTYAVNLVFPRLGEVWRCGYISQRENASFTKVVGSMVADRLSDTVTVLLLTLGTFFLAQDAFTAFLDTYPQVKDGLVGMLTSWKTWAAAALGIAVLVWLFTSKTQNKLVLKVKEMVTNLWQGFAAIGHMDGKWMFILYTICIWGCYFLQLYVAAQAFTFTHDLTMLAVLVLFVLSSIGMGIPTNGGLGAWHMAIIFGLSLYGLGPFSAETPNTQASAFAMLVWGIQTLLLIVLGIYAFTCIALEKKNNKTTSPAQ